MATRIRKPSHADLRERLLAAVAQVAPDRVIGASELASIAESIQRGAGRRARVVKVTIQLIEAGEIIVRRSETEARP